MVLSNPARVIGLVGGIASGKSFVASELERRGATLIAADEIGHTILQRPSVVHSLVREFGQSILASDGSVDREAIAQMVFGRDDLSQQRLKQLEALVHPLIHAESVRQLRAIQEGVAPPAAIVLDAPLLIEAGWLPLCDLVLFVECDLATRQQRALARGWDSDELAHREAAQLPLDRKRREATHVVTGSADQSSLLASQLDELWREITGTP